MQGKGCYIWKPANIGTPEEVVEALVASKHRLRGYQNPRRWLRLPGSGAATSIQSGPPASRSSAGGTCT